MIGDKHGLLVIGTSQKLQCFKNVRAFSADYSFSKNTWMTNGIWSDWLCKWDRERQKIYFYLHHNSQFSLKRKKQRIVSNIAKNAANEKIQKATKQVNTIAKQNNNNTKA